MDLQHLRASDGTGEAVLAHIQSVRNPGSTVLDLDNVDNWNTKCVVVTGTPNANGFISAAGMKVMYGHLNAGDFIIDGFAPGYVDNGNLTTEVAIVKMTTSWADALVNLLGMSHQDSGILKITALDHFYKPSEVLRDCVVSGGILAGLGYGSTLTASLSAGVIYINGIRNTIAAVATRTYTASKDTYVDALYNASGVATIVYTEVANNAASPALAANSIRLGIVVTGAGNIAASTSIGQGGLLNTVPVISSQILRGFDSLGNLVYPKSTLVGGQVKTKFSLTRTAAWTSSNSFAVLQFDTKISDTNNECDVVTNKGRFTAKQAGWYWFSAAAGNDAAGSTVMQVALYKNGSVRHGGTYPGTNSAGGSLSHVSGLIELGVGDYVEARFLGGNGSSMYTGSNTYFDGFMVSGS